MWKVALLLIALIAIGLMIIVDFIGIYKESKIYYLSIFKNLNFYLHVIVSVFWFYGAFILIQRLVVYFSSVN